MILLFSRSVHIRSKQKSRTFEAVKLVLRSHTIMSMLLNRVVLLLCQATSAYS